ncbi:hypothetical protein BDZ94DRAFT_1247709 [Collybia nuda]|uniref:Epidermal growth factor receptor substrate 15-like 1 n=1 Tax=Collybia nuda TaxID=64659 RepID=A0A9P6CMZ2_9AGAR|nr:hypothetical protein BDZ94DRAFT_1247709 [Collybia nuda]
MTKGFFATEEEEILVSRIFARAGDQTLGIITGDAAVEIFAETVDLPPAVLGIIWNVADEEHSGNLTERGLAVAVRLIGWAQSGKEVTPGLVNIPGPVPQIRGISDDIPSKDTLPPFTLQDLKKFRRRFWECGPLNDLLDGDKARDCFLESKLSPEDLWQIWNVADTQKRGTLDFSDFALGMYLIQAIASGQLISVPSTFPKQIYEKIRSLNTSYPSPPPPLTKVPPPIPYKPSVKSPAFPTPLQSPRAQSFFLNTAPIDGWDVSQEELSDANFHYDALKPDVSGYVEGDLAAKFMLRFNLPPEDLAHIWDLADINNDNRLTRDEFAVATHLIKRRLSGAPLPFSLPHSLVPPSLRSTIKRPKSSIQSLPNSPAIEDRPKPNRLTKPRSETLYAPRPPIPPKPTSILKARHSISHISAPQEVLQLQSLSNIDDGKSWQRLPSEMEVSLTKRVENLEKENTDLESYVKRLLDMAESRGGVQTQNEELTRKNESLSEKIRELESLTSQLIAESEENEVVEDLTRQNRHLTQRVADMDSIRAQLIQSTRHLELSTREIENLKSKIQQLEEAAEESSRLLSEAGDLKARVRTLEEENEQLKSRTLEMERSISHSQPSGTKANIRELRILMKDVTRENEDLKKRMRDMDKSTAQLLLSKDHATNDALRRRNTQLSFQVQELEQLTQKLQTSSDDNELQRVLEQVTQENEGLKTRLRQSQQTIAQLQATSSRTGDLEREVGTLKTELRHLKVQLQNAASPQTHEDPNVPPPAYDEDFITV